MGWAERRNPRSRYNRKRGMRVTTKSRKHEEPEVVMSINVADKLRGLYDKIRGKETASN